MYRKFTADHIFNGYDILSGASVLVTDAAGVIIEIIDEKDAGDDIEQLTGLLTPGFVNAHCHLELSHLKDMIPPGTGLVDFVQQVMGNRQLTAELKSTAMARAEAEMYSNGIVAVGDICNTPDSVQVKLQSNLHWHNFIEVSGFTDGAAQKRMDDMRKVYAQFAPVNKNQRVSFSPHAPYSVSKTLFHLLDEETAGELITIHNQECAAEDDLYRNKTGGFLALYKNFGIDTTGFEPNGVSSFQTWLPYFTKNQSIISVHNTFLTAADLDFSEEPLQNSNAMYYCLCANANKYIEQKIPPIGLLRQKRCDIVLGTDSLASNWQLNILEEIKTIQEETGFQVPLEEILQWATINGARALQLDHLAGSFEKGKKPGIVLIEGLDNLQTVTGSFSRRIL
ncbi:MAG: amidohydrolase family protein [Ferruginibacter sp.]